MGSNITELLISLRLAELGREPLDQASVGVRQAVADRCYQILSQIPRLIIERIIVLRYADYIAAFASSPDGSQPVVEWLSARYQEAGVQEIAQQMIIEDRASV